jgi:hypothetical protein
MLEYLPCAAVLKFVQPMTVFPFFFGKIVISGFLRGKSVTGYRGTLLSLLLVNGLIERG